MNQTIRNHCLLRAYVTHHEPRAAQQASTTRTTNTKSALTKIALTLCLIPATALGFQALAFVCLQPEIHPAPAQTATTESSPRCALRQVKMPCLQDDSRRS